jgi:hypothetical protein
VKCLLDDLGAEDVSDPRYDLPMPRKTKNLQPKIEKPKKSKKTEPVFDAKKHRLVFFDLGLHMGWASLAPNSISMTSGTWELARAPLAEGKRSGIRMLRLQKHLEEMHAEQPDWLGHV